MNIEPEEEHSSWGMYFDGTINIHENRIRAILIFPAGADYPMLIKLRFSCTNNMAEYEACNTGPEAALEVYRDPILIINQSMGESGVKSPKLAK